MRWLGCALTVCGPDAGLALPAAVANSSRSTPRATPRQCRPLTGVTGISYDCSAPSHPLPRRGGRAGPVNDDDWTQACGVDDRRFEHDFWPFKQHFARARPSPGALHG